ncbi:Glyoxylase-like metal-dependent hydrolase (Beta-lactamase superfamily II) [Hyphomicrobiales bacterium]|nr:Glyoxylase-like metal-dependent hydrolase (Beta-lactamase superfamily II) [Hyphomicrobiales bacterium]CAH1702160.1 Glyoxylase-like metal-dependent hydrolase (Beta-lactamase superfamily II) [Hyphomicrobiales bacterium]CAI0346364.1 N-acyl homoserine lactone hydrolase [Hyphomicrobiales bacterium]
MLNVPADLDDGVYHLYALRYATLSNRLAQDNFLPSPAGMAHSGVMPISYYVWIIHGQKRTVIVDTGFSPETAAKHGRNLDYDPIDALGRLGVDCDQLEDVILTHLHVDHASNLHRFAKARFHIQEAEVQFAAGPCMCEPMLRAVYDVEDVVTLIRRLYEGRVSFQRGDGEIFPGISVVTLPGHTLGIQAVRVITPRGPVVLASDVTHFYANLLLGQPFKVTVDVAASLASYWKLRHLAGDVRNIVPGHDPKVYDVYPKRRVSGIELAVLHERPEIGLEDELIR